MRGIALALLAALAVAGCSGDHPPPPAPPSRAAPTPPPPVNLPPPAPVSLAPPPPPDQCGAYLLAGIVGRPRSEIPIPVEPSRRRVVCTTCPRSQDFRPDRVTIEYEAATGRVSKVSCG